MPRRFCIVTMPRSGSNLLRTLLDSHPLIACNGEIFHRWRPNVTWRDWQTLSLPTRAARVSHRYIAPMHYLRQVEALTQRERPEAEAIGFKLFPYHSRRMLQFVCGSDDYRIIHLTRANKLLQYASDRLARRTRQWSAHDPARRQGPPVVEFRIDDFRRFIERHQRQEAAFRRILGDRPALHLDYDEVRAGALDRVLDHIGVPPTAELSSEVKKQNPGDWRQRFANPDEVAAALRTTRWARYLAA